jgi:hypothetical protein
MKATAPIPEIETEEWDDTKWRHAYQKKNRKVAICGYAGPSTWQGEKEPPPNACPICLALLKYYFPQDRTENEK